MNLKIIPLKFIVQNIKPQIHRTPIPENTYKGIY